MKRTWERDEDGLFQTYCQNCGAVLWNATDNKPHPNCEFCPEHDDIARRDQEAADREKQRSKRKAKSCKPVTKHDWVRCPSEDINNDLKAYMAACNLTIWGYWPWEGVKQCKRCLAKRVHGFDLRELKDVFERIDRLYPEESPKKRGGK